MEALANSRADHSQKIALKHKLIKKEDKDDGHEFLGFSGHDKKKTSGACGKKGSSGATGGGSASSARCCQAESCCANLSNAKQYHKRHKVCEHHAKAQVVIVAGIRQRFCQQCSRFHEVSEFDDIKRSCRTRLAGHNERRRKSSSDHHSHAEAVGGGKKGSAGSSSHLKEVACGQQVVDNNYRGRNGIQMKFEDKPTFKHFQIK